MLIVAKPRAQSATIKVNTINHTLVPVTSAPITLETVQPGVVNIKDLRDVNEGTPANNATLIFNSTTQKFDVIPIVVDGGIF